ncbi:MAG: diaminopimelate epimerase [Propionibacteriaceae bacterium]|nr:diaminopimelate epimerase [Propionibacteriaceae bacterium]
MGSWNFAKGQGTLNDFVILSDIEARLDLTPELVRFLCHRRRGVGGDGVLRLVRAGAMAEWSGDPDLWFMDYRNADGSIAEMCGNGARVFVRYLVDEQLVTSPEVVIATRAGQVSCRVESNGQISLFLPRPQRPAEPVTVGLGNEFWPAHGVAVGNPHAVVRLDSQQQLAAVDLRRPPQLPADQYPAGGNVEFVWAQTPAEPAGRPSEATSGTTPAELQLRVWERGVGETFSCGTGVVAAAFDHLHAVGADSGVATVTTPGGRLEVEVPSSGPVRLTGPAVIVARGTVTWPDNELS